MFYANHAKSKRTYYANVRERRLQTVLARLRIGHTRLTHSYLMSGEYQPYCDDCLVPLTVWHLLVECPSLVELRQRFLYAAAVRMVVLV